ncbi:MAG: phosphatase PAP2 family protein [Alphaproteobacteria bacterium]|nr:MAG: phosphatase PAP2 family protein [Alphaproteobacteria bacterium]
MKERPETLWVLAGIGAIAALIAFADRTVYVWMEGLDGLLIQALRDITQIGNARWYLFGMPVVFAVALWLRERAAGDLALALDGVMAVTGFVFLAVALSGIATNVLKFAIGRARPKLLDEAGIYGLSPFSLDHAYQSLPSGHTTTLFAVAAALACLAPRWRIAFYTLALLLAASRTAVGAHYPSDLVAGAMVAIGSVLLLRRGLARCGLVFRELPGGRLVPKPSVAALAAALRRS